MLFSISYWVRRLFHSPSTILANVKHNTINFITQDNKTSYAVKMISPKLKDIFSRFAINITTTAKYNALPSMLQVAPIGNENCATLRSTLLFSVTQRIVTGKVAELHKRNNKDYMSGRS